LVLDFALLEGIGTFILDDGEELLDSHVGGCSVLRWCWGIWEDFGAGGDLRGDAHEASAISRVEWKWPSLQGASNFHCLISQRSLFIYMFTILDLFQRLPLNLFVIISFYPIVGKTHLIMRLRPSYPNVPRSVNGAGLIQSP
jgi:hypothetical protein